MDDSPDVIAALAYVSDIIPYTDWSYRDSYLPSIPIRKKLKAILFRLIQWYLLFHPVTLFGFRKNGRVLILDLTFTMLPQSNTECWNKLADVIVLYRWLCANTMTDGITRSQYTYESDRWVCAFSEADYNAIRTAPSTPLKVLMRERGKYYRKVQRDHDDDDDKEEDSDSDGDNKRARTGMQTASVLEIHRAMMRRLNYA